MNRTPEDLGKKGWLVISYLANMDGVSTAQWIDDRLISLKTNGIDIHLLTSPCGARHSGICHVRVPSVAPAGIRYELGFILQKTGLTGFWLRFLKAVFSVPLYPLCLLEKKAFGSGGAHLSWSLMAIVAGYGLCRWKKPALIYATGGATSAHIAAVALSHLTGIPYIAEFQDPLIAPWTGRNRLFKRALHYLEKAIYDSATKVIYCTRAAKDSAEGRQTSGKSVAIYPGASPHLRPSRAYARTTVCKFGYFGTLYGSRNVNSFLSALELLFAERPEAAKQTAVELYGSIFGNDIHEAIGRFPYDVISYHGRIARAAALEIAANTDVLLLIQHADERSTETIPAKVYEYLQAGRPILGLVYHNDELRQMLESHHHLVASADNPQEIKQAILCYLDRWAKGELLCDRHCGPEYTVEQAARQLVASVSGE